MQDGAASLRMAPPQPPRQEKDHLDMDAIKDIHQGPAGEKARRWPDPCSFYFPYSAAYPTLPVGTGGVTKPMFVTPYHQRTMMHQPAETPLGREGIGNYSVNLEMLRVRGFAKCTIKGASSSPTASWLYRL